MAWVKLDDQFFAHRKIIDLSKDAKLLFLAGLTYSAGQLTDGFLTQGAVRALLALVDIRGKNGVKTVAILTQKRLWIERNGGYEIHDYLQYQPSAAEVLERRAATARKVSRWRASNQSSNPVTSEVTNPVSNATPQPKPNPLPQREPPSKGSPEDVDLPKTKKTRENARSGGGGGEAMPSPTQGESAELALRVARAAKWGERAYSGNDLVAVLRCYTADLDAERIIAETVKAREWCVMKHRKLDLRTLDNWLQREHVNAAAAATAAAERQRQAKGHEGQHDNDGNGTERSRPHASGISPIRTPDEAEAEFRREQEALARRAAERAAVVRELESARLQQSLPRAVS